MTLRLTLACSAREDQVGHAWTLTDGATTLAHGSGGGPNAYGAELQALVDGLAATPAGPVEVHLANDNIRRTATEWLHGWRRQGWRKKGGIQHLDLVKALAEQLDRLDDIRWVQADPKDPLFRRVQDLAREARRPATPCDHPVTSPLDAPAVPTVAPAKAPLLAYSDGGCRGNPGGVGGWGMLLIHVATGTTLVRRGGEPETTNNRMELLGAIQALEALTRDGQTLEIRTDSKYVCDLASKWMAGWKRRGWTLKEGEPVKNLDLVQRLEVLCNRHRVIWTHVKGHAGEPGNEQVDALANAAMDAIARGEDGAAEERPAQGPVRVLPPQGA